MQENIKGRNLGVKKEIKSRENIVLMKCRSSGGRIP
jgi:hypothetical protein